MVVVVCVCACVVRACVCMREAIYVYRVYMCGWLGGETYVCMSVCMNVRRHLCVCPVYKRSTWCHGHVFLEKIMFFSWDRAGVTWPDLLDCQRSAPTVLMQNVNSVGSLVKKQSSRNDLNIMRSDYWSPRGTHTVLLSLKWELHCLLTLQPLFVWV